MRLTIANITKTITPAKLQDAVRAIARQVAADFQPEWHIGASVVGVTTTLGKRKAPIQGQHDAIIYLGDSSQDPTTGVSGALGYHSQNHGNTPYGFVYLDVCKEYGEVWTCTLSHEVLELLADPTASMTVTGPSPRNAARSVYFDLEVCDPTQGDSYRIDGVVVSNFVGRSYFGLHGGSGKTNFLELDLAPFGVRPKGYFQYEDAGGAHQVQGRKVSARMTKAKSRLMGAARRNARRATRLGPPA
jgi:hypothetical protein